MAIPLEDLYSDILGKALRGQAFTISSIASKTGIPEAKIQAVLDGEFDSHIVRTLADILSLDAPSLIAIAEGRYKPSEIYLPGLAGFNSPFGDMTVNSYLAWDATTREAAVFDTGADASEMLDFLASENLTLRLILLTHTHGDHILELDRIKEKTGAPAHVGDREPPLPGAHPFRAGKSFDLGRLRIETRLTWGHARGGITYLVHGLGKPLAVVGDAIFAGSMGGGQISYPDALATNRLEILSLPDETIIAPGHGPLTTVGEQKISNPFFASNPS